MAGKMTFPLCLKNIAEGYIFIAGQKIGTGDVGMFPEVVYKKHKAEIDLYIDYITVDGKRLVEVVSKSEADEIKEELIAEKEQDVKVSVVRRFVDGNISWQGAIKEIKEIKDVMAIRALYSEAHMLGLGENSAVVRGIVGQLDSLLKPGESRGLDQEEDEE